MTMSILQRARSSDRLAPYLRALERVGLPAWFVVIDLLWILKPVTFAIDARNYQRAAAAWLSGGDPWQTIEMGVRYGSGPHTLLFYAPTSFFPFEVAVGLWMVAGLAAAVWVVRRLDLPIWWIAFPPLFHAIWNGNPQTVMLALLVVGHPVASAAAAGVKLYALVQLIFRPRHFAVAVVVLALSTIILPWQLYLASADSVAENMLGSWDGSAARVPILLIPTVAALWILRHKDGQWWSIPAVWPATQFYYVATVLPAVSTRPVLAALTAIPVPLMVPAIVIGLAVREVRRRRQFDESAAPSAAPAAT
ncbi:MAG: hypothetical protein ACSLFN_03700 [Candidatus Limnocylindrales bacterium]